MAQARMARPTPVNRNKAVMAARTTAVVPHTHHTWRDSRASNNWKTPAVSGSARRGSSFQTRSATPWRTSPNPRVTTTMASGPTRPRTGATVNRSCTPATPAPSNMANGMASSMLTSSRPAQATTIPPSITKSPWAKL
jgi:hypothetical protein